MLKRSFILKIALIQGSSQKDKNPLLEKCLKEVAVPLGNEIFNFGIFENENFEMSYIQAAFCISMLLESGAVDFAVTGCSSGQGMMLACNSLSGILCGYVENPSDAYLFGRINGGNAISYPLGLNFGWAAEINLKAVFSALFSEPFCTGYPKEDSSRKIRDTEQLKKFNSIVKKTLVEILPSIDDEFLKGIFRRKNVYDFIIENGRNHSVVSAIKKRFSELK